MNLKDKVMPIECEMEVLAAIGPFDDELLSDRLEDAVERIRGMDSIKAVQLILATYCRSDSVVDRRDLDNLADFMGVFEGDDDTDGEDA